MHYAAIKNNDIANGPGVRVSLFVSGCTHRCPGCFNEEAWDFQYGQPFTQETIDEILRLMSPAHIKGLTLLGGEPFDPRNQPQIVKLLQRVKQVYPDKSVWAFSGYLFEEIISGELGPWEITDAYLRCLDVLVDGPFIMEKKDLNLRFRGSSNQRLINIAASRAENRVVLWEDWQGSGRSIQ